MAIEQYQINENDTLQHIARRRLGSADQWWILARFNKLDYPFIDTSGAEYLGKKVLGIGDTLLIVKDVEDPSAKRATATQNPDQHVLLFGVDMDLSDDGDLQVSPATGDWQLTSGVDNLVKALKRRYQTRSGIYPYHPEYGSNLEQYIGQALDPAGVTLVRLEAIQTALNEPRVLSVRKVSVNAIQEHVDVQVTCSVIGGSDIALKNIVLAR